MSSRKRTLFLAVCVSLMSTHSLAEGAADSIDIEKQPLPGALQEFSEQTGLQLAYVATLAKGKTSPGTRGRTRPEAALSDILEGSELRYQYVNNETVAIGARRAEKRNVSATSGSPPALRPVLLAQAVQTPRTGTRGSGGRCRGHT